MRNIILFGLLIYATGVSAIEPYYTWVDEDGVRHYSQMAPHGTNATLISEERQFGYIKENPKRDNPPPEAIQPRLTENDSDQPEEESLTSAQKTAQLNREIAQQKAAQCERGKRSLRDLGLKRRVRIKDADGTIRMISYEEKQAMVRKQQEIIDANC